MFVLVKRNPLISQATHATCALRRRRCFSSPDFPDPSIDNDHSGFAPWRRSAVLLFLGAASRTAFWRCWFSSSYSCRLRSIQLCPLSSARRVPYFFNWYLSIRDRDACHSSSLRAYGAAAQLRLVHNVRPLLYALGTVLAFSP